LMTGLLFSNGLLAGTPEEAIAERIKKVGTVCVEGQDCVQTDATTAGGEVSGGATDVAALYNKSCVTCHGAGVAGAPIAFKADSWADRVAAGMPALYQSAISGKPPGMPAKGMCFTCSDNELRALVDYMLEEK